MRLVCTFKYFIDFSIHFYQKIDFQKISFENRLKKLNMKKLFGLFAFAIMVASISFMTSCKKDSSLLDQLEENVVASQDMATTQSTTEADETLVDQQVSERGGPTGCPTKTFSAAAGKFPLTVTLDFGTTGCTDANGKIRKGIITIVMSDTLSKTGATRTVTLSNYSIDGVQLERTVVVKNTGKDANGNPTFSRTVTGGKATFPTGKVATWSANQNLVQTAGAATKVKTDDIYNITGSKTGVTRNGKAFTATVTTPLIKRGDCKYIVQGKVDIEVGANVRSLDFGSGDCDDKGVMTLANGKTRDITLGKYW